MLDSLKVRRYQFQVSGSQYQHKFADSDTRIPEAVPQAAWCYRTQR